MQAFGPYQVVSELGRGGMGVVYEVRHPNTSRRLALKQVLKDAASPDALTRFQRESELLARVHHPSVVRAHDGGKDRAGNPYLVTDLVEGEELGDVLKRGAFPAERAVPLVRDLARALEAVHQAGCLHRDLKPANVILTPEGTPVLIDFGLAREAGDVERLTRTGTMLGTPNYMAPEQAEGISSRELDQRVDVYGLGGVLFACLTGRPPVEGSGLLQVVKKVLTEEVRWPKEPKVDPALRGIVERALSKEPAGRFRTAADLADELERYLAGEVEAPPTSKLPWIVVGAVGLLAVGLAAFALLRPEEKPPEVPPLSAPPTSPPSSPPPTDPKPKRSRLVPFDWSKPETLRLGPPRSGAAARKSEEEIHVRFLSDRRAVSLAYGVALVMVWELSEEAPRRVFWNQAWKPKEEYRDDEGLARTPYGRRLAVDPAANRFLVAGEQDYAVLYTWDPAAETYQPTRLNPARKMEPAPNGLTFDLDAFSAAFDTQRNEALIGLREGMIVRFDLDRDPPVEVGRLEHPESVNPVNCLALSPDGQTLASANGFNHTRGMVRGREARSDPGLGRTAHYPLFFWKRTDAGWELARHVSPEELVTNGPEAIVFQPRRTDVIAVGGRNGQIHLFGLKEGLLQTLNPRAGMLSNSIGVFDLQFSPEGDYLFATESNTQANALTRDSAVRLWKLEGGEVPMDDLPTSADHRYMSFRIAPAGRFAILGRSGLPGEEDGSIQVFDARSYSAD